MTRGQIVSLVAALLGQTACAMEPPPESSEWFLPVPADTSIREFPHVGVGARTELLSLERDLVLREAFGQPFTRLEDVAVSEAGDIYVLDQVDHRVAVFGAEGQARHSFGRAGEGPGESRYPHLISVIRDRVFLHSRRLARLNVFDLRGIHVADHSVPGSFTPELMTGVGARLLAVDAPEAMLTSEGPRPALWSVGLYSLDGRLIEKIVELQRRPEAYWAHPRGGGGEIPVTAPDPRAALSDDVVYITDGREYQVLALGLDGAPVWALRVDYTAPAPSDAFKRSVIGSDLPEYGPGWRLSSDPSIYVWPEHFATIENLEVDGLGNLYVFPYAGRSRDEWQEVQRPVPVDVYTPEGERLFTGWSEIAGWDAARGEHVYRVEHDAETEELVLARYRLHPLQG